MKKIDIKKFYEKHKKESIIAISILGLTVLSVAILLLSGDISKKGDELAKAGSNEQTILVESSEANKKSTAKKPEDVKKTDNKTEPSKEAKSKEDEAKKDEVSTINVEQNNSSNSSNSISVSGSNNTVTSNDDEETTTHVSSSTSSNSTNVSNPNDTVMTNDDEKEAKTHVSNSTNSNIQSGPGPVSEESSETRELKRAVIKHYYYNGVEIGETDSRDYYGEYPEGYLGVSGKFVNFFYSDRYSWGAKFEDGHWEFFDTIDEVDALFKHCSYGTVVRYLNNPWDFQDLLDQYCTYEEEIIEYYE